MKTHNEQSNLIRQHERRSFDKYSNLTELDVDQPATQQVKLDIQSNMEVILQRNVSQNGQQCSL